MVKEAKTRGYGEELSLSANMIFNGTLQLGDDDPQIFFLRRMAIKCRTGVLGETDLLGAFDGFQACDVGTISSEDSMNKLFLDDPPKMNETVFGGRRRPLVVDLRLLQKWLRDCITEHGKACHSEYEIDVPEVCRWVAISHRDL